MLVFSGLRLAAVSTELDIIFPATSVVNSALDVDACGLDHPSRLFSQMNGDPRHRPHLRPTMRCHPDICTHRVKFHGDSLDSYVGRTVRIKWPSPGGQMEYHSVTHKQMIRSLYETKPLWLYQSLPCHKELFIFNKPRNFSHPFLWFSSRSVLKYPSL